MNFILSRTLIFCTFLGSCIVIGFLLSATAKDSWISSEVSYIPNPLISSKQIDDSKKTKSGNIQLGLFYYEKTLNSGYGVRQNKTKILDVLDSEIGFMDYNIYILTCCGLCLSFIASGFALVSSIFGTLKEKGEIFFTAIFNSVSLIGQITTIIAWIYQQLCYLTYNMVLTVDKKNWTSKDLSRMSKSFYFLLAACIMTIINLIVLFTVKNLKRKRRTSQALDEKEGNSIMLY